MPDANYKKLFDLCDRVAIVTGAASGIGKAIAAGLATYGADIVVADIDSRRGRESAAEIKELGRQCAAIKCDVSKPIDVDQLVEETLTTFGRVGILVNSAGVSRAEGPAAHLTERDWDDIIGINLKGTFLCCQRVGRVMIKQKRGRVINIGSIDYQAAIPELAAYCASKGGVVSLTKALALEWAPYNVTLNVIAPSEFETPLLAKFAKGREKELRVKWVSRAPIPRGVRFHRRTFRGRRSSHILGV